LETKNGTNISYHDIWEIITRPIPKLDPMPNDYKKKTKIALLTFSLEDEILPHIHGLTNVIDVWKKLKNLYETSNEFHIVLLTNKLTSLKIAASNSITDHVQKLQELKPKLLAIDSKIKEKEFITILFNSLLDVYRNFVTSSVYLLKMKFPHLKTT